MDVIHDTLIDHMMASQENMHASLDIYLNFNKALATKTYAWTQKVHDALTSQESALKLWRNGCASAEDISFSYKYWGACYFVPAETKHVGVQIEFRQSQGEEAIIGIYLNKEKGDTDNLRESMTEFVRKEFPDRYERCNAYWPCYEKMQAPYNSWVTKDLITELYDEKQIMLYTPIRELCLATQSFLNQHSHYATMLKE